MNKKFLFDFPRSVVTLGLPLTIGGFSIAPLVFAVAAASVGISSSTSAEELPAQGTLEEVVVSARRRDETLQEVPIAVTSMSDTFLREHVVLELSDLAVNVPSLGVGVGGSTTNSPVISLRGQRPSEVLITLDPAVPLYFAEVVASPTQGTNLAFYDLQSIQVLKGPQGTLFGRNSTGGAVLLTPMEPGEEFGGYAKAGVGDYSQTEFEGAVDLPVNQSVQFRIAGRKLDRDGYQSNVADNALRGNDQFWDEDSGGLRVGMKAALSDKFRNYAIVSYDENEMNARVPVPVAFQPIGSFPGIINSKYNSTGDLTAAIAAQNARDWTKVATDVKATEKVENIFAVNTTEYDLSDHLTVKNIFGYRDLDFKNTTDTDGTSLPIFGAITDPNNVVTLNPELNQVTGTQYSDELQLLGDGLDDRLQWITGVYWYQMDGSQTSPTALIGAGPQYPGLVITQNSPKGDADNEAWALFGEATYDLTEQWALSVGARGTWDERSVTVQNTRNIGGASTDPEHCLVLDTNGVPLPDDACSREESDNFSQPTWRSILSWTPKDELMLYGSVSTGYRTGGYNLRGSNNVELEPFDPETVTTYELGAKADWTVGSLGLLRTNFAIYSQDYQDIQQTRAVGAGGFGTTIVNASKATINGAEAEITLAPTDNLILSLSYAYVDPSYDENEETLDSDGDGIPDTVVDISNNEFSYTPKNSLTSSAKYILPLDGSIGEISMLASVYWQDDMVADGAWRNYAQFADPNSIRYQGWSQETADLFTEVNQIGSYAVWDFRVDWIGVMGSSFDVAAYVKNAADETYETGGLMVPETLGYAAYVYGPPRVWGATVRYNFD